MACQFANAFDFAFQGIEPFAPKLHLFWVFHALGFGTIGPHLKLIVGHDETSETSSEAITDVLWVHELVEGHTCTSCYHIEEHIHDLIHTVLVGIVHTVLFIVESL